MATTPTVMGARRDGKTVLVERQPRDNRNRDNRNDNRGDNRTTAQDDTATTAGTTATIPNTRADVGTRRTTATVTSRVARATATADGVPREERRRNREERRLREEQERAEEIRTRRCRPASSTSCRTATASCAPPATRPDICSLSQVRKMALRKGTSSRARCKARDNGSTGPCWTSWSAARCKPPSAAFDKLALLLRGAVPSGERAPGRHRAVVDMIAPIDKGQRGMVVSPPKAGKTTILSRSPTASWPRVRVHLIASLVDERPEEVTDWRRTVSRRGRVSTFDKPTDQHVQVTELVLERAKRLAEQAGRRDNPGLADAACPAYNLSMPTSGKIMSVVSARPLCTRAPVLRRRAQHRGGWLGDDGNRQRPDEPVHGWTKASSRSSRAPGTWKSAWTASSQALFPAINVDARAPARRSSCFPRRSLIEAAPRAPRARPERRSSCSPTRSRHEVQRAVPEGGSQNRRVGIGGC